MKYFLSYFSQTNIVHLFMVSFVTKSEAPMLLQCIFGTFFNFLFYKNFNSELISVFLILGSCSSDAIRSVVIPLELVSV